MMNPKKYGTEFVILNRMLLAMSEEEQAKLLALAFKLQDETGHISKNLKRNIFQYFTSGIFTGIGLVIILFLILR